MNVTCSEWMSIMLTIMYLTSQRSHGLLFQCSKCKYNTIEEWFIWTEKNKGEKSLSLYQSVPAYSK